MTTLRGCPATVTTLAIVALVIVAACTPSAATPSPSAATSQTVPAVTATIEPPPTNGNLPTEVPTPEPTPVTSAIVGSWDREQTCQELLAVFQAAGLAESHREWLQGSFFGGGPGPATGDPCAGAAGPLAHSHWFTAAAEFGSLDEHDNAVDNGDYSLLDAATLDFPSHADEFGFGGDLAVGFVTRGDEVTFSVQMPPGCVGTCADAFAWALSAFASGPWTRGVTP